MTDGNCRICPKKCRWDWHNNHPYIYVDKTNNRVETMDSVKKEHDQAKGQLSTYESIKLQLENQKNDAVQKLNRLVGQIRTHIQILNQTAIIAYSMDMYKYFTTLSKAEVNHGNHQRALEYEKLANQEKIQMQHKDLTVELIIELSQSKIV